MNKLIYSDLTYKINGSLFQAHNEIGRFCNEKQYGDLLEQKIKEKGLAYEREKIIPVSFEGETKGRNIVDFLIDNKVILELKSKRTITKDDYYQVKRYLEAYNLKLGIIVNFRQKFLSPKRILNSKVKI